MRWILLASLLLGAEAVVQPGIAREPPPRSSPIAGCSLGLPILVPADVEATKVIASSSPRPSLNPPVVSGERLRIPPEIPGAGEPPLRLPATTNPADREKRMKELYGELPALPPIMEFKQSAEEKPLTLSDLQQLALSQNPKIRQAVADVEAARGQAVQAGLYPNPSFGYQGDQIGGNGTAGQQGAYLEQLFKTAGKLRLAQAAAWVGVLNAEVSLRRTQIDLINQTRADYFAFLVARDSLEVARALALFSEEVYRAQISLVRTGQAAPYEPAQVFVLAMQARANVIQAHNRSIAAWKQLSATLGDPDRAAMNLAGRADAAVPEYVFEQIREQILERHTDVRVAQNNVLQTRYLLRLAEVTPIPDINTSVYFQRDNTTNPAFGQVGVQVGVEVPLFNRNQGGIRQAQAQVARAELEISRTRNDLSRQIAEAYERYQTSRTQVMYYREKILPAQVRVYRAIYQRYQQEPEKVDFVDIVNAQQTLASVLTTYLSLLGSQWEGVVDVARLVQSDDLYATGKSESGEFLPLPELLDHPSSAPRRGTQEGGPDSR